MLHGRLLQLGAQLFCARGEGNEQHPEGFSGGFRDWIVDLKESLLRHFPLPPDTSIIGEGEFLEPKWILTTNDASAISRSGGHGLVDRSAKITMSNGNGQVFHEGLDDLADASVSEGLPDDRLIPVRGSHVASIRANARITPTAHWQDVRLMELTVEKQIQYGPGAVAVIYPKNFHHDVDAFLSLMDWQPVADVPLRLALSERARKSENLSPSPLRDIDMEACAMTLRTLLTNHLDILSIPRRSFFASLAYFTKSGDEDEAYQQERILELANPELIDELWDYTTRPRRTILEVLPDFPSVKIPWQYALSVLPIMRGRQFSIASGGPLKSSSPGDTRIQLLVAIANPPNPIIKYRKRHGVCTRYIASLKAGQQINVGIQQGYLDVQPEEARSPVILIGPGTGVAPLRSMIYERLRWSQQSRGSTETEWLFDTLLFFGCRNRDADYFFADEWKDLVTNGLEVFTAFSRDNDGLPNYVQDQLLKQSNLVYNHLQNRDSKVYVCGSSGNMPKGVRQALVDIVQEQSGCDEAQAEAYLDKMEKAGRYKQETW